MTLNAGSLVSSLSAEQQKMRAAMLNALRADMVTIVNRRDEWRKVYVMLAGAFAATIVIASTLRAQVNPDWTEPFPPFRIAGNLYYVGSKDLASYFITTPRGHILINSDLAMSAPRIRAS